MNPRRTKTTTSILGAGGNPGVDDLYVQHGQDEQGPFVRSVWEPSPAERAQISAGANVELVIAGRTHPPVGVGVTQERPLGLPNVGAGEVNPDAPRLWVELTLPLARKVVQEIADLDSDELEALRHVELSLTTILEHLPPEVDA